MVMKRTGWFVIIPLIFIAIGGAFLFFSISRLSNQTTTTGVIVNVETSSDSDGTTYRPVIEFTADDGFTYTFTGRIGSSSRPTVGNSIEVLYDPADPQGATEKTFSNLWLFPIAFGGFGLIFLLLMAFGKGRLSRKRLRPSGQSDEEAAAALDRVLERIPDIGPAGPADSGPLEEDTFSPRSIEVDEETPTQARAPVGGATAEFRRAEASIANDGTMKYRVVAKDDAGNEYYGDLLDEDPTVVIMEMGNTVELVQRRGGWVVDFQMREGD